MATDRAGSQAPVLRSLASFVILIAFGALPGAMPEAAETPLALLVVASCALLPARFAAAVLWGTAQPMALDQPILVSAGPVDLRLFDTVSLVLAARVFAPLLLARLVPVSVPAGRRGRGVPWMAWFGIAYHVSVALVLVVNVLNPVAPTVPDQVVAYGKYLSGVIGALVILASLQRGLSPRQDALLLMIAAALLQSIWAILWPGREVIETMPLRVDPHAAGMLAGMLVSIAVVLAIRAPLGGRLWWAAAVLGMFGVVFRAERAPLVGLAGLVLGFVPDVLRSRRFVVAIVVVIGVVGAGYWATLERFEEFEVRSDRLVVSGSAEERAGVMTLAWKGFLDRPIVGWGYQSLYRVSGHLIAEHGARDRSVRRLAKVTEPHSGLLEVIYNGGALAGVPFAGLLVAWMLARRSLMDTVVRGSALPVAAAAWWLGPYLGAWLLFGQLLPGSPTTVTFWLAGGLVVLLMRDAQHAVSEARPGAAASPVPLRRVGR